MRWQRCLAECWSWGELSGTTIQKLAQAATEDGLDHEEARALSSIGTQGKYPNKCNRDLVNRYTLSAVDMPLKSSVQLPFLDKRRHDELVLYRKSDLQLPHDVMSFLAHRHPEEFALRFGSAAAIRDFWENQDRADPKLRVHPILDVDDHSSKAIPIKIHSDAVVCLNKSNLHVVSYSSLLGTGEVLQTHFHVGSAMKESCCRDRAHGCSTMSEMFRVLAWSFAACLKGEHPATDGGDKPWPANSDRAKLAGTPLAFGRVEAGSDCYHRRPGRTL